MMIRIVLIAFVVMTGLSDGSIAANDKLVVHHRPPEGATDRRHEYFRQLLVLALEKTRDEFGDFEVKATDFPISQARAFELTRQGRVVDVVWTMTTDERERQALPVRVPLLKGLIACRVLLIHESEQEKFRRVDTLDDLGRFAAVQGAGWPDTDILEANGLQVVSTADYDGMFHMLAEHRVDYFPRSVMEVGAELATFRGQPLAIAPGLAFRYEAPIYFFVAPNKPELHRRLSAGLERVIADGSFDALFEAQPGYDDAQQIMASIQRVFDLHNPLLSTAQSSHTSCGAY